MATDKKALRAPKVIPQDVEDDARDYIYQDASDIDHSSAYPDDFHEKGMAARAAEDAKQ